MKSRLLLSFGLLVGALSAGGTLFAHHGAAAFANTVVVLKEATVTKYVWANPHTFVMFDVKDDKGDVTHWAVETGNPSAVALVGWNRNSLQPGDVITVYLYPAKSGSPLGRLNKIVLADGKTLRDTQQRGDNPETQ
jgi:Family of unknown function (DUF6152)